SRFWNWISSSAANPAMTAIWWTKFSVAKLSRRSKKRRGQSLSFFSSHFFLDTALILPMPLSWETSGCSAVAPLPIAGLPAFSHGPLIQRSTSADIHHRDRSSRYERSADLRNPIRQPPAIVWTRYGLYRNGGRGM